MQTFQATTESGTVYTIKIDDNKKLPMAYKNGWDEPKKMICIRKQLLPNLRDSVSFYDSKIAPMIEAYNRQGRRTLRVLPKRLFVGGILADPYGRRSTKIVDLVEI